MDPQKSMFEQMADFFKNYLSDEALKTKVYGTPNPSAEQMQDKSEEMANYFYGFDKPAPAKIQTNAISKTNESEPVMTLEQKARLKEQQALERKRRVQQLMMQLMQNK